MAIDQTPTVQSPAPCGSPPASAEAKNRKKTVELSFSAPKTPARTRVVVSRTVPRGAAGAVGAGAVRGKVRGASGRRCRDGATSAAGTLGTGGTPRHRPAGCSSGQPEG